ncbi:FKBP-type peptidyl-prolyl cis-trans isomerase [Microbacterium marinilacus]|uniref:peptidylprolyl isomerase n=1 Tax=Microbacterium marinilacus TaxID=415209 RepID=A0ABP7BHC2_9MICO|nr:FKBP-type peptidyl-prolyl cis-trans isomerase [Microbacterium marinilacus]MBY0688480.1 FKBP-type peptidyl-prolyl cis-trans isomerase [Microbacterium marinilacus]
MRRTAAVLSLVALVGAALVGCAPAGSADATCDRVADSDPETMDLIEVSGALDDAPDVHVFTPFAAAEDAYADVVTGDGPAITDVRQPGVLDITLFDGETGAALLGTAYSGDVSAVSPFSGMVEQFPAFEDALMCATEGSRIAVALSQDGVAPEAREYYAQAGFPDEGSLVAVIDVRKVLPRAASGQVEFNDGLGLPTVVRTPDGVPGVIVPDATAPDELVVQTLIKGDGPVVGDDEAVVVQYTGVTWDEREVFDSTWESGSPATFVPANVVPGFAAALEDQTVGSQIMVVIPPDQGYGDQAQGSIPAGSTLVFVIDVLGTAPADTLQTQ